MAAKAVSLMNLDLLNRYCGASLYQQVEHSRATRPLPQVRRIASDPDGDERCRPSPEAVSPEH